MKSLKTESCIILSVIAALSITKHLYLLGLADFESVQFFFGFFVFSLLDGRLYRRSGLERLTRQIHSAGYH